METSPTWCSESCNNHCCAQAWSSLAAWPEKNPSSACRFLRFSATQPKHVPWPCPPACAPGTRQSAQEPLLGQSSQGLPQDENHWESASASFLNSASGFENNVLLKLSLAWLCCPRGCRRWSLGSCEVHLLTSAQQLHMPSRTGNNNDW